MDKDPTPAPFYKSLYFQVITAIVLGGAKSAPRQVPR